MVTHRPSARSLQTDGKVGLQFASYRYGAHRTTPGRLCRYEICEGEGTRIPLGRCGNDGGREMNSIGCSRTRLPSSLFGRGRSPGPPVTQEALGRPGFSLSCHCYESRSLSVLALANPDPPSSPSHLIIFVSIATSIRNGTDGLGEPTA
jgi:hypothetical protein